MRWLRLAALAALFFSAAAVSDELIEAAQYCEPEGGCAAVRRGSLGRWLGPYLPWAGLVGYSLVFVGTLLPRPAARRPFLWASVVGGVVATALLIAQWVEVGRLCELCLGVDLSGLAAGLFALVSLRRPLQRGHSWPVTAWLSLWVISVGLPPVVALSRPTPVPSYVRSRLSEEQVTIVEVSDFGCPYCRAVHGIIERLRAENPERVRLVRLPFPLRGHPGAFPAAKAFLCAEQVAKGDELAARLFASEDLGVEALLQHAADVGLPADHFQRCLFAEETEQRLSELKRELEAGGVVGVPLVWVNDRRIAGFREGAGAEPYHHALTRAAAGQPARNVPLPFIALGVVVAVLVTWAGRRTARDQEV